MLEMPTVALSVLERTDFDEEHGYRDLLIAFRQHLRAGGLRESTIHLRLILIEQVHRAIPDLLGATTDDLEAFLASRRHTHGAASRRSTRTALQGLYKWLAKTGRIAVDPAADLAPIRVPRSQPRIADDESIMRGLEKATLPERAMIMLGALAGLRLSEIAGLHSLHRERDVLRVCGKGGHVRMVPLNSELMAVLEELEQAQGEGFYFRGHSAGGHMHPQALNKHIRRLTGWNPHALRHRAGTTAYQNGGHDLRAVQELLGHASLSTTEIYLHVSPAEVRRAADATSLGLKGGEHDVVQGR